MLISVQFGRFDNHAMMGAGDGDQWNHWIEAVKINDASRTALSALDTEIVAAQSNAEEGFSNPGADWVGHSRISLSLAFEQLGERRARGQKVTDPGNHALSPAVWGSRSQTVALNHRSSSLDPLYVREGGIRGFIKENLGNKK